MTAALSCSWRGRVDITDRKRAEADREKFVTLVESSTDFIGMCDLAGTVLRQSRRARDGRTRQHRRGAPHVVAVVLLPEDQTESSTDFPSVLERGHGEVEVRFRPSRRAKRAGWHIKCSRFRTQRDGPIAFATVSQDVTERKRLADNLAVWRPSCPDADRRKNEFMMLAHELRNPLAPISNAARALRLAGRDEDATIGDRNAGTAGCPDGEAGR